MQRTAIPRPVRLLIVVGLVAGLVAGCSGSSRAEEPAEDTPAGETGWTFTDDFDVTHELPEVPDVIVAEVGMAASLWDLGIEVDATFGQRELPDGRTDPLGLADPDAIESIGDVYGEVNTDRLEEIAPDIVVTSSYEEGEPWGIDEDLVDDVERAAPIVVISIPDKDLRGMADRIAELAATLGVDLDGPQATEVIDGFERAEEGLRDALAAKPDLTFIAMSGSPDLMYVAVPSGFADLTTYQDLGMDLVVPDTDEEFWQDLSWEQADTYTADVILGDARGGSVEQILDFIPDSLHSLPAIEAGQLARWEVVLAPGYANLARVLDDLTAVVEDADPDVVEG